MSANKKNTMMLVGGILLILHGVIRIFIMREYIAPMSVIYYLGFIALGVGLVSGILPISIGGAGVSSLLELIWVFQGVVGVIDYGTYYMWWVWILQELIIAVALILLIVMMIPLISGKPGNSPGGMSRMWYLPGVIAAIGFLPQLFTNFSYYFSLDGLMFMVTHIGCFIVGLFIAGCGLSKAAYASAYPSRYGQGRQAPGYGQAPGYRNPPYGNQPYGNQPQTPRRGGAPYGGAPYGNAPYGGSMQAPGYGPAQSTPVSPVTPVAPSGQTGVSSATMSGLSTENVEAMIKYKQLLDAGVISQAEFDELKKKLLG